MGIFEIHDTMGYIANYKIWSSNPNRFMEFVRKHLDTKDVELFYPQNLFEREKTLKMIFFTKKQIIVIEDNRAESGYSYSVNLLKYEQIKKIKLSDIKVENRGLTLNIEFENNDSLLLNSLEDFENDYWEYSDEKIEEIFLYLQNVSIKAP